MVCHYAESRIRKSLWLLASEQAGLEGNEDPWSKTNMRKSSSESYHAPGRHTRDLGRSAPLRGPSHGWGCLYSVLPTMLGPRVFWSSQALLALGLRFPKPKKWCLITKPGTSTFQLLFVMLCRGLGEDVPADRLQRLRPIYPASEL